MPVVSKILIAVFNKESILLEDTNALGSGKQSRTPTAHSVERGNKRVCALCTTLMLHPGAQFCLLAVAVNSVSRIQTGQFK